jgi:hypothetical protein
MSSTFHPNYLKAVGELETLSDSAQQLLGTNGLRRLDYLERQGHLLFGKLSLELVSLLRLIPGSKYFGNEEGRSWDFPSAAVLGRQILEDCRTFVYLVEPRLLVEQLDFRKLVWEYHADKERARVADLYGYLCAPLGPKDSLIPVLKRQAEARLPDLKKAIEEHPCLTHVNKTLRGLILKGDSGFVISKNAILSRLGITKSFYDAPYTNLSNFVHSSAFTLEPLPRLKVLSPMTEAHFHLLCIFINFLFATALGEAIHTFGGTKSLNDKISLILKRNRAVLENSYNRASGKGQR